MAQTRVGSFVESVANIAVGFGINFTANLIVLPWFGFDVTPSDAFGIGLVFTVISLARSEEHTSALQSLMRISYAVFCLKKKTNNNNTTYTQKENCIHIIKAY